MIKITVKSLLAALFLITFVSCQKTKDNVNKAIVFDINYTTNQTIPSSSVSVSGPVEFVTPEVPTESAATFSQKGTSKELIDEIKMTKFVITNQSGNLDFLKSMSVYLRSAGLTDVLVATKTVVPTGVNTVSFDMTNTNIKEFIFKEKIQFRISVTVNNSPTTNQVLKLDQTVTATGKIF